jgi:hypothetical protein
MYRNTTYLVCTFLSETPRNVGVKAPCFNRKGERDWAYFVTGREFCQTLLGRTYVRVTPRFDFPQVNGKLVVETCPSMRGNDAADAARLLTVAEADLEFDPDEFSRAF